MYTSSIIGCVVVNNFDPFNNCMLSKFSWQNQPRCSLLTSRQELHDTLQRRLLKAQASMKVHADSKRQDITFEPGQWVYVRLRPFRQRSMHITMNPKLSKRYFGPFQIIARVGQVAYHLRLPAAARIHPVFHCKVSSSYRSQYLRQ